MKSVTAKQVDLSDDSVRFIVLLWGIKVPGSQRTGWPRLWISYLWTCGGAEGDFRYLVSQLRDANIDATYDSLQLQPDVRLWQRIVQRLISIDFDGWAYILTHQFLTRRPCADELMAAIDQTLLHLGTDFPMVGLLHGVAAQEVPPGLRVRPCLSVGDPEWKHRIAETLKQREHLRQKGADREETRFIWRIHSCYGGDPSSTAIEVSPRLESIQYWRFAMPKSARAARWGVGASGGGEISPIKFSVVKGCGKYASYEVAWFGAANGVTTTESAYVVFYGPLPDFVCFGPAESPFGPPAQMEILRTG